MTVRLIVRSFSELCITVGALIVLFVAYLLFWTGVKADNAADHQIDDLHHQWARSAAATPGPAPGSGATAPSKPKPAAPPPPSRTTRASPSP